MADGPDLSILLALVAWQDYARNNLGQQAASIAQQMTVAYADWYAADSVVRWSEQVAENVGAVLSVLAGMTDAYLTAIVGELTGKAAHPTRTVSPGELRRGISHPEAYQRSAMAFRWQQSRLDDAAVAIAHADEPKIPKLQLPVSAAVKRSMAVANRDVQLVVQQQSARTLQAAQEQGLVTGWRRMVHPELSKTGTCGLCIAASTRIYHTGELMPIHDNCNCLPMPITEDHDPGLQLDRQAFAQLYGEAGSTRAADLKKTRYVIHDNGELGPVLAPEGAKQRSPRQVRADTSNVRPLTPSAKDRRLQTLQDSLRRSLPRLDELAANDTSGRWADYRTTVADRIGQLESSTAA